MATILVTGAAGFIGSHTCDQLLHVGYEVVGADNLRSGHRRNLSNAERSGRFRLLNIDLTDEGCLRAMVEMARPSAIVHLAALVSVPESIAKPSLNFHLNVRLPQLIVETARSYNVGRIIFASSAAVYGENPAAALTESGETRPISPYGGAKLAAETLLLSQGAAFGIVVRCMRYFNVFGPRQDPTSSYSGVISIFGDRLRAGLAPTIFGDGEQTRDFISVHDVARANIMAATAQNLKSGITNICTGRGVSLKELGTALRRLIPNAPEFKYAPAREGDIRHSVGSPDRALAELGFSAKVSLEAGLAELVGPSSDAQLPSRGRVAS